jgi:ABC-2 type transport system permease protein
MIFVAATRSELTKQFTTALWWVLAIILVVYVGFVAGVFSATFGATASGVLPGNAPDVPAEVLAPLVYSVGTSVGYVFPLLVGTLLVTGEFRHHTLTPTFLAVPRRGVVLMAKLAAAVVLGALYGALAALASVGVGAGVLAAFGIDTLLDSPDTWAMIARMLLASVLWALLGVGVGATVRNQVAAVVLVLAFTQFIEPIGRSVGSFVEGLSEALRFLPGSAADALVGTSVFQVIQGSGGAAPLEWWAGALVLAAYAAVFVVVGQLTSWRRDVN